MQLNVHSVHSYVRIDLDARHLSCILSIERLTFSDSRSHILVSLTAKSMLIATIQPLLMQEVNQQQFLKNHIYKPIELEKIATMHGYCVIKNQTMDYDFFALLLLYYKAGKINVPQ